MPESGPPGFNIIIVAMIVHVHWMLNLIDPRLVRSLLYISGRIQLALCWASLRLQNSMDADGVSIILTF